MNVEKIICYDIETLAGLYLIVFYIPEKEEWREFGLWDGHNSLEHMYKYLEELKAEGYYLVGYNNVAFDAQVVEFIMRNLYKLWDKTTEELLDMIYRKSQNIINDTNAGLFPPYRESSLFNKQIDLFKIAHFDNKNKRVSLKWLEYMMDMPDIEDMPIHHTTKQFSAEEIAEIIHYCRNDVKATYQFYLYLRGRVEHEEYRGKDKIQDRIDIINELGFPLESMNYSDVKIGDELNKMGYSKLTGKSADDIYRLKRGRKQTTSFTFGDCIPSYVKFTTPQFDGFYRAIRKERVMLAKGVQEYSFTFNTTEYTIARGGAHSCESCRILIPSEDEILRDADIGSQYPNAIAKRGMYPAHLGKAWNTVYAETIQKRMEYKAKGKTERKYKGLAEMYKLALNGGGFGKLNEQNSWQYDPFSAFKCTIGNEFEILMLIEMLETNNIHCVSANTDGIVCLFPKDLDSKYYEICHEWERAVGNDVNGKLEYQDYKKLIQESVNCYYGVKDNGEVKKKGRWDWEGLLEKNNSKDISRIERKALHDYFTKDVPIEETIKNETNLFMFCIGVKATSSFKYDWITSTETTSFNRIVRYYVSKTGGRLVKMKKDRDVTSAKEKGVIKIAKNTTVTVCNTLHYPEAHIPNVNYEYYIEGAESVRDNILRAGKMFHPADKNQLSLFN